jgi:hypothetical protein
MYRPLGAEFRVRVGLDPREREMEERLEYLKQETSGQHAHRELELKFPGGKIE